MADLPQNWSASKVIEFTTLHSTAHHGTTHHLTSRHKTSQRNAPPKVFTSLRHVTAHHNMILCSADHHRPNWRHVRHRYKLGEQFEPTTWRTVWIEEDKRMTTVARDALVRKAERLGHLEGSYNLYSLAELAATCQ